jgi:hypothetical protein
MFDLQTYGIADKWPKLRKLQKEVADLEQRRDEAEREVMFARNGIPAARDKDAEAASVAIRIGRPMPQPKHEAEALAALEGAERTSAALSRAVQSARADLNEYMAQHSGEIRASVVEALRDKAHQLARHAREAAVLFGQIEDSRYDLKALAPPPAPPDENAPAQRLSTSVIAIGTARSTGPARGDVEQMLGYLAGLEARFVEPGADNAA